MAPLVSKEEITGRMKKIPEWDWNEDEGGIERTFEFDDFAQALEFVNAVAEIAEREDHHPDIDIRWNKVRLALSTHSAKGLTDLDFSVAHKIDLLEE